jgi:hypothetical protein
LTTDRDILSALSGSHANSTILKKSILVILVLLLAPLFFIPFVLELRSISLVNGWWFDELWSLWASDPSLGFIDAFTKRMTNDTTPPLYYIALFLARIPIADERSAVDILNLTMIAAACTAICLRSRKAEAVGWALVASVTFLYSGPVLRFVIEGRSYLTALATGFTASWFCALAIVVHDRRPNWIPFLLIGMLAALTHVYAALFCCCLASGLTVVAYSNPRPDLFRPALALGLSAGIITFIFIAWAMKFIDQTNWIDFSYQSTFRAYWEVKQLALGSRLALLVFVVLFVVGSIVPSTRLLTTAFGLAWGLFVLIPFMASFVHPIILARYWVIGAPSLIVFVVFLLRTFFGLANTTRSYLYCGGFVVCLALLVLSNTTGYIHARIFTSWKPIWRSEFVAPLIQECPAASVHTNGYIALFADAAHVAENVFVDANSPAVEFLRVSSSQCSVLGWAEHLNDSEVLRASNQELLFLLKIEAVPSDVEIVRHSTGFVVTRR